MGSHACFCLQQLTRPPASLFWTSHSTPDTWTSARECWHSATEILFQLFKPESKHMLNASEVQEGKWLIFVSGEWSPRSPLTSIATPLSSSVAEEEAACSGQCTVMRGQVQRRENDSFGASTMCQALCTFYRGKWKILQSHYQGKTCTGNPSSDMSVRRRKTVTPVGS